MKYPKRSQYQHAKSQYRVRNWPEYEAGLKKRGDLTVWLSDDALEAWRVPAEGKPGGQRTYSDVAIKAALTIRMVFHLPLRQTEGFLRSLAQLLKVDLPIPDHTTLSRRLTKLSGVRFRSLPTDRPIPVLIDSTGLRIHVGHLQKPPRNRTWRKLHLAVDADTGEIVASDPTARRTHDCTAVPDLLEQLDDPIASVSADGAYDTRAVYEAVYERGQGRAVRVLIPNSARSPRPGSRRGIATFARSENSDGENGMRPQATASGAWSRIPCTGIRRSSVEVCGVGPSMGNAWRYSWRTRFSTR